MCHTTVGEGGGGGVLDEGTAHEGEPGLHPDPPPRGGQIVEELRTTFGPNLAPIGMLYSFSVSQRNLTAVTRCLTVMSGPISL